jgi:hypothetical protein
MTANLDKFVGSEASLAPPGWQKPQHILDALKKRQRVKRRDMLAAYRDCGSGAGGFKPGNKCAAGGDGDGGDAPGGKKQGDIPPASELKVTKRLGGSTGAMLAEDKNGNQFVIKGGNSSEHVRSESAANDIYRAAGAPVPAHRLDESGSKPVQVTEYVPGPTLDKLRGSDFEKAAASLRENFAADALLANWDVIGLARDNIVVPSDGRPPMRIDNGGSLDFRAQGKPKAFGPEVGEITSMRTSDQGKPIFGKLSDADVAKQIGGLEKRRKAILAATPAKHRDTMKARLDYMAAWAKKNGDARSEARDCGSGAGGFKPGNKCAGGDGSTDDGDRWPSASGPLTREEENAIGDWTNDATPHRELDEQGKASPALLSALAKMPRYDGLAYRGMILDNNAADAFIKQESFNIKGVSSFGSKGTAMQYADPNETGTGGTGIIIRTRLVDARDISEGASQPEYITRRASFKVVSVTQSKEGVYMVVADQVDPKKSKRSLETRNCGTGSGGFGEANTCAKGGAGDAAATLGSGKKAGAWMEKKGYPKDLMMTVAHAKLYGVLVAKFKTEGSSAKTAKSAAQQTLKNAISEKTAGTPNSFNALCTQYSIDPIHPDNIGSPTALKNDPGIYAGEKAMAAGLLAPPPPGANANVSGVNKVNPPPEAPKSTPKPQEPPKPVADKDAPAVQPEPTKAGASATPGKPPPGKLPTNSPDSWQHTVPNPPVLEVQAAAIKAMPIAREAIQQYTGSHYKEINNLLRQYESNTGGSISELGKMPQHVALKVAALDAVTRIAAHSETKTLYRGVGHSVATQIDKLAVGAVWQDTGYLSCSTRRDMGESWSSGNKEAPGIAMRITTKYGLNIQGISAHKSEAEVLLPRRSQFRLKSKEWRWISGKPRLFVDLEHIGWHP